MARYKKRECPGCGDEYPMPANEICFECTGKIKNFNQMQELLKKTQHSEQALLGFVERIPLPNVLGFDKKSTEACEFRQSLEAMINELSPIVEGKNGSLLQPFRVNHDGKCSGYGWKSTKVFNAPRSFENVYGDFALALSNIIQYAYKQGQNRGQSLLKQLNDGSLSMSDFEERRERK